MAQRISLTVYANLEKHKFRAEIYNVFMLLQLNIYSWNKYLNILKLSTLSRLICN